MRYAIIHFKGRDGSKNKSLVMELETTIYSLRKTKRSNSGSLENVLGCFSLFPEFPFNTRTRMIHMFLSS